jgi:benzoylformate decarboxylase
MGVRGIRIEKPDEVRAGISEALEHPGPALIELVVEGDVRPEHVGVHCGQ